MRSPSKKSGFVLQSILIFIVIGGVAGFLGVLSLNKFQIFKKKREDVRVTMVTSTAIETMLLAYRMAELKYIKEIASRTCATANPFLQALREGSACAGASVEVFKPTDVSFPIANLYSYGNTTSPVGCTINTSSSSCTSGLENIITLGIVTGTESQKIEGNSFEIDLTNIIVAKQLAEFSIEYQNSSVKGKHKRNFAIRPVLPNAAHLEPSGKVVQENPDPLARCPGNAWGKFLLFAEGDQKCVPFEQIGSGTGLAFYKGKYFGFRPFDGQIIDLEEATTSNTYLVEESGNLAGKKVFPAYNKDALRNVDDITLIEDEIYYVALYGTEAQIGVLDGTDRKEICDLGGMGWSQSYNGIAALNWSEPLKAWGSTPTVRSAVFFIKTFGGDLLTAVVEATQGSPPSYTCMVFKDKNLQQIEYTRTDGFDRTSNAKPYFLF